MEEGWKGWKEFRGCVGCSEIELGGCFSPTDLLSTLVHEISCLLRLNMDKMVRKLFWELKSGKDLHPNFPRFSTRDRAGWIGSGFNINNDWRNRKVGKDKIGATDGKIDMGVGTTSLL